MDEFKPGDTVVPKRGRGGPWVVASLGEQAVMFGEAVKVAIFEGGKFMALDKLKLSSRRTSKSSQSNPLDGLNFPVSCAYPGCGEGPFSNSMQVDEHITESHLPQAIWTFALEQMR